jgi:hypothetical protein
MVMVVAVTPCPLIVPPVTFKGDNSVPPPVLVVGLEVPLLGGAEEDLLLLLQAASDTSEMPARLARAILLGFRRGPLTITVEVFLSLDSLDAVVH